MSTKKDDIAAASGVTDLLSLVRNELFSFFREDSHHWKNGRLAHVYFEPVMRGKVRYEDRELMTIEARQELHRVQAYNRFGPKASVPERAPQLLERTDLEVHVGLRNPNNPHAGKHILVGSVGDAFSEFMSACSWMVGNAEHLSVTMILCTSAGPLAILVGDSTSGELKEDRQALMQARITNALKNA